MMKYFLLFLFVLLAFHSFSQDTIFKRNKEIVVANITMISSNEIKYIRPDIGEKPLFSILTTDVEHIKLRNGEEQFFKQEIQHSIVEETKPIPLVPILVQGDQFVVDGKDLGISRTNKMLRKLDDPEINRLVYKAKKNRILQYTAFGAIPFLADALGVLIASGEQEIENPAIIGGVCVGGAAACLLIGYINHKKALQRQIKAVELYNLRIK